MRPRRNEGATKLRLKNTPTTSERSTVRKTFLALIALATSANAQTAADSLQWRNIGPTYPGRIVAVAGSVARPDEYYLGSTGGGVWKTTDGGKTVVPVTDAYFGGTIGAIAVAESNPDIV